MHWIIAHIIGDYILQNDYMAINKKNSSAVCALHIVIYILPFVLFNYIWWDIEWWKILLIAIQHFIQDRTHIVKISMDITGKSGMTDFKIFGPWGIVLMDNIYHIVFISLIFNI